jgi:hypothetical protein
MTSLPTGRLRLRRVATGRAAPACLRPTLWTRRMRSAPRQAGVQRREVRRAPTDWRLRRDRSSYRPPLPVDRVVVSPATIASASVPPPLAGEGVRGRGFARQTKWPSSTCDCGRGPDGQLVVPPRFISSARRRSLPAPCPPDALKRGVAKLSRDNGRGPWTSYYAAIETSRRLAATLGGVTERRAVMALAAYAPLSADRAAPPTCPPSRRAMAGAPPEACETSGDAPNG